MPKFKGYNSIGQHKSFAMTDFTLIKRDLLNAFLTREGEVPGRPDLGTGIWSYVFEGNDIHTRQALEQEVTDIIDLDPRLRLEEVDVSYNHNTVVIEVAVTLLATMSPETLKLIFDENTENLYMI